MRILLVHPFLTAGGAERQVLRMAEYFRSHNVKCAIATLRVDYDELPLDAREFEIFYPAKGVQDSIRSYSLRATLGSLKEAILLRNLVRKQGREYTILNPHNFPAMWACAFDDRPVVWNCNEPPDLWPNPNPSLPIRWVARAGIPFDTLLVRRYVTQIATPSEWGRAAIRTRYDREAVVVSPGVDADFFSHGSPEKFRAAVDANGRFVLLQVATLDPQKNQLASVAAVADLVREGMTDLYLVLIGNDASPYAKQVHQYVEAHELQDFVQILGTRSHEEVRDAYAGADLVLFPTLEVTLGISPVEGICAGTPCVVSPQAGIAKTIERIGGGIVSSNLPQAIREARDRYEEIAATVPAAARRAREIFSWDVHGGAMIRLLHEAEEGGGGAK